MNETKNDLHENTGYILYIDILGYSEIIKSGDTININKLRDFIKHLQPNYLPLDHLFDNCDINKFHIKYFSDNIFIFYQSTQMDINVFIGMCYIANYIQSMAIVNGFMTRGSLMYGRIEYNKRMLFGASIIEATDLEKYNLSPSVCLSSGLKQFTKDNLAESTQKYLNPFGYFHNDDEEAKELCLKGIQKMLNRLNYQKLVDEKVIKKYEWLIDEYNRYFNLKIKKKIIRLPSSIYEIVNDINYGCWSS